MINFTKCKIDKAASYGGSDQKRGIYYKGKKYMLKMSDRIFTEKRNELNSSYSNSIYSEYICCTILNKLGYTAQNTLLGTIEHLSSKNNNKIVPVVACENFIPDGYSLIEFKVIEGALLDRKPPKIPKLIDLEEILKNDNEYLSGNFRKEALKQYWDVFIFDALFGNFDRHANNWGYLVNEKTEEIKMAPIYDCGSCLYPQISDDGIKTVLASEEEINNRLFKFPKACLDIDNKKVDYYEYLNTSFNYDCLNSLIDVFPKINFKIINEVIDNTTGISNERKNFYKFMLNERYTKILQPAYIRAKNILNNKINVFDLEDNFDLER